MSRIIGTIHGCDVVEEDDGSVTFSAGATLDAEINRHRPRTHLVIGNSAHVKEIEAVSLTIDKAYEHDRGRALYTTVQQWQILRDPNRNLFGGFLRDWCEKGSLNRYYIAEKKPQIARAFDLITAYY